MKHLENYIRKGLFYEAVVEDGSDIIFVVDFEGNILYHNGSVKETLGYRAKSLIGKNFFDYIIPEKLTALKASFKQVQKRAYTQKVEFQFRCKDKSYRFLEFNAINLNKKNGLAGLILDCRDITQRKRDAEELVRLQKAKEQFLANISHEIRTPINGIAGMASLLSQNQSQEERQTYLNAIKHSAENLKVIINDILDVTAIESGKLKFEKIAFNLTDLLPSLLSTFTYQAREKNIRLDYTIEPALNTILTGDPVRLNQILINLVSNAVKFTHTGFIHVKCIVTREQKDTVWVKFLVQDTGVGIPKEKLETIFESFSQADESVTRRYGGTGLGLTIAKQLVELQNGSISVESKEQQGSTFTFTIPYPRGANTTLPGYQPPKALHTHAEGEELRDLHVLLVEDNDINRLYAESILKTWNCKTDTAENGLVALEKLKNHDYDVILMDIQMPVMDGYETTKAIRMMPPPTGVVPIIALTANATRNDINLCIQAGMNDYLPKPFAPEDLYQKLVDDLKLRNRISAIEKPRKRLYDLNYLRNVSGNNTGFIREMITTFVQSIPNSLKDIQSNVDEDNWINVARIIHQIKPTLTLLGIESLKEKAVFIEDAGKKGNITPELKHSTHQFITVCKQAVEELRDELKKLS
jgi:PAS domain S-box-containing protein